MNTKSNKNKLYGKQNRPSLQTTKQSLKMSNKLNPNLSQKVTKGIESHDTSTTLNSNIELELLSKSNVQNSNQTQSSELLNQTSISKIQEERQDKNSKLGNKVEGRQNENKKKGGKSEKENNEERQEGHYIIPGSAVEGQFQRVSKQKKQRFIAENLKQLQQKGQIQKFDNYEQLQWASDLIKNYQETVESERNWKQEKQQLQEQDQATLKHYILPDSMYEGQFTYVTKEKKEEDVDEQLKQLENEKKQLEISTSHYIIPNTVVQGQVEKVSKQLKKQQIQKDVKQVEEINQKQKQQEQKPQKPKIVPRVNLHQFHSYQVPQLHQQDIPLQHKAEQPFGNLFEEIQNPTITQIKQLDPVPINLKTDNQQEKLNPLYIDLPKRDDLPPQYQHYIIPGTMYEGQFTYVTKEKKQEDVQEQLKQLQNEKRELQIGTQHYIIPTSIVEGQIPQANKDLKKDLIEQEVKKVDKQKQILRQKELEKLRKLAFDKNQYNICGSQPNIGVKNYETRSQVSRLPSFQFQSMRFSKEKDVTEGSLKFQINSKEERTLPIKIDKQTAMTVLSANKDDRVASFVLPKGQEPNYDLEVLVLDANLNNESSSPKDFLESKPTSLINMDRVPDILRQFSTKEGSPLKVFIGTKQFANFPNQVTPSPPIIDQVTLKKLRKQNQQEMERTGQTVSPPPRVFISKSSDQSYTFQKKIQDPRKEVDQILTSQDCEDQPIYIEDLQETKRKNKFQKSEDDEPPFSIKLIRCLAISSLIGGFAWIGLKDKKITAVSAVAAFAITLIAQK